MSSKVSFIAEFCQNHNGDFHILEKMVKSAALAGAQYGKIQHIYANNLSFRPEFESIPKSLGDIPLSQRPYSQEYDRLKSLELSEEQIKNFIKICFDNGLEPMTTCFAREHVHRIKELGFSVVKIASYDCASFQMLREMSKVYDKIILSTGATFNDEIEHAVNILNDKLFALMHCVTIYPTPDNMANLSRLSWLKSLATSIGYSDHSKFDPGMDPLQSMAAIFLGAQFIERHYTILHSKDTKDGVVSIDENGLKLLRDFSNLSSGDQADYLERKHPNWRILLGTNNRELSKLELANRYYYRGRFVSRRKGFDNPMFGVFNWEETPLS